MTIEIVDTPFHALELEPPDWVETSCREPSGFGHPTKNIVRYGFSETKHTASDLLWTWHDGAYAPPRNETDLLWPLLHGSVCDCGFMNVAGGTPVSTGHSHLPG